MSKTLSLLYRTLSANYSLTPHFFEVTAGTVVRQRRVNGHSQRRQVDEIILHPQMKLFKTGITDWDLALLHLKSPLSYGDHIQPICLPEENKTFPSMSQCYLAGWGFINTQEGIISMLIRFLLICFKEKVKLLWYLDCSRRNSCRCHAKTHYLKSIKGINTKLGILAHHDKMQLQDKEHNSDSYHFGVMSLFNLNFKVEWWPPERWVLVPDVMLLLSTF